jgi:recombination protein RecT
MGNGQIVPINQKVNDFRALLGKMQSQLALALPKHLNVERMMRICLTTVQRVPALLECSQASVLGSILQAAQLGLEPDGILGEAYLIPYNGTCQLIPGYKGLMKLARNSGQISTVYARVVHAKDAFRYSFGLKDVLKHVPSLDEEPGEVSHAYAVARLKDGSVQFEVMSRREIEAIRKRSKAGKSGPWVTDWDEMAKKTVLRRLSKTLPASVELQRAVVLDEQVDANLPQTFETVIAAPEDAATTAEPEPPRASKLDELAAKASTPPAQRDPATLPLGRTDVPNSVTTVKDGSEAASVAAVVTREPGSDDGEDAGDAPSPEEMESGQPTPRGRRR